MRPALLLPLYCVLIVAGSLLGGWLPSRVRLTHTRMQVTISFVAGLMLGVAVYHMLPHAAHYTRSLDQAVWWLMIGLVTMFFLIRAFHFHDHGPIDGEAVGEHAHGHGHDHGHSHRVSWVGVAIGLALHTAIDGVALATSVVAEAEHGAAAGLFGVGTFLAVLLHKPLDALSITSLMAAGGWSPRLRHLVNLGFALMCPLGAAVAYFGLGSEPGPVVGCALAFSAGVFLCIALGDLLPEIQFHRHDRLKLSVALLLGIAVAYAIGFLETHGHDHHHHDHGHHGHDHPH